MTMREGRDLRLFAAAELPENLWESLAETSAALRGTVYGRFVGTDLFHVTLAFLGEVPASRTFDAVNALRAGCAGRIPFETSLGALGSFGRTNSAVLWQGFASGRRAWRALADGVREALRGAGFSMDEKGFIPHVTLMRRADLSHGTLPVPVVDAGVISSVALFSSDLGGDRPRYEVLERIEG